jgi:hypothetical protein
MKLSQILDEAKVVTVNSGEFINRPMRIVLIDKKSSLPFVLKDLTSGKVIRVAADVVKAYDSSEI